MQTPGQLILPVRDKLRKMHWTFYHNLYTPEIVYNIFLQVHDTPNIAERFDDEENLFCI